MFFVNVVGGKEILILIGSREKITLFRKFVGYFLFLWRLLF